MKVRFKPVPKPFFSPFDGLDVVALREAQATKQCKRGAKLNPKTGKSEKPTRRGSKT